MREINLTIHEFLHGQRLLLLTSRALTTIALLQSNEVVA